MILRHVLKKDIPVIRNILKLWIDEDPGILGVLETLTDVRSTQQGSRCSVTEVDRAIHSVCLWSRESANNVRILALGLCGPFGDPRTDKFLREQVLDWSGMGITRVRVRVPAPLVSAYIGHLRSCGFFFEGISSSLDPPETSHAYLCKHFLYRAVPYLEIFPLLEQFLVSSGYEVRGESEGFRYRTRSEFCFPFVFNPWHRISLSGKDIIAIPPAKILDPHELETLFFPLRVMREREQPLLLTMEPKNAHELIDLPDQAGQQNKLFEPMTFFPPRSIHLSDISYTHPSALKGLRKGLPLLFYVNSYGAVGSGRVEGWDLDEPERLCRTSDQIRQEDLVELRKHSAGSGSMVGKVLVINFQWYRAFKKIAPLEQIRDVDKSFNPQRTRTLSQKLFDSIVLIGNSLI